MLKKMMAAAALAGAFAAVPAAAQDSGSEAVQYAHEQAVDTKKIVVAVNQSAGTVARQMLDLVSQEAKAKAVFDGFEFKKRPMSLNEAIKCHDCKQEKRGCRNQEKCDVRDDCQKAKCQKKA